MQGWWFDELFSCGASAGQGSRYLLPALQRAHGVLGVLRDTVRDRLFELQRLGAQGWIGKAWEDDRSEGCGVMALIFGIADKRDFVLAKGAKKTGYAALPGTGPAGETCKSCRHFSRHKQANTWFKCELMRALWTRGHGTDIKAGSPACRRWKKPIVDADTEKA
jgi:hypothetical protein